MLTPFEMAIVYWRRLRGGAIFEVERVIEKLHTTSQALGYWDQVLHHLKIKKDGKNAH